MFRRAAASLAGLDRGLWVALALTLPALEPLLRPGVGYMADVAVHIYRTVELLRLWQDGILYSRWAPDLAFGLGYPLFHFYTPLFYYLAGGLTLPGLDVELAVKTAVALILLASAAGMYALARQWLGEAGAVLAAVAYAWSPFRLREAYFQGDYAQLLAMALPPLVMWALHRLLTSGKDRYFAAAAAAYAGLFLSHSISTMLFSPLIVAYVVLVALTQPRTRPGLPKAVAALLVGAGLSAFFWYPALSEMHLVRVEALHAGDFDFRRHFPPPGDLILPSLPLDVNAVNPHLPFNFGLGHLVLAIPALWLVTNRRLRWAVITCVVGLAGSAFMMLPASTPVWQAVPPLPLTEFPWRWLGVAALPLAFLVGASTQALPRGRAIYAAAAAVIVVLSLFPHLYPREPFTRYDRAAIADVVAYEVQQGVVGTTSAGEYLPKGVEPPQIPALLDAYAAGGRPERLDRSTLPAGATFAALEQPPLGGSWRLSSPAPFRARVLILDFPGWTAYLDGRPAVIVPEPGEGIITVDVPAGEHTLALRFEVTPSRLLAGYLSLAVALLLISLLAARRWRPRRSPIARTGQTPLPLGEGGGEGTGGPNRQAPFSPTATPRGPTAHGEGGTCEPNPLSSLPRGEGGTLGSPLPRGEGLGERSGSPPLQGEGAEERSDLPPRVGEGMAEGSGSALTLAPLRPRAAGPGVSQREREPASGSPPPMGEGLGERSGSPPRVGDGSGEGSGFEPRLAPWQALGLIGIAVVLLVGKAAYVDPHTDWFRAATDLADIPGLEHRLDANFGDEVSLIGYSVDRNIGAPGDTIKVTLFWRALRQVEGDYAVFVHLGDDQNDKLAQQDKPHPGDVPIKAWQPNQFARDEHVLQLPEDMPPGIFQFRVGLYDHRTMERLSVVGSPHNFTSFLEPFRVGGPPPKTATGVAYTLGEDIRLVGYRIVNPSVKPGETVQVHLYWELLGQVDRDFTVFVHLYDGSGQLLGAGDRQPLAGQYPTSRWQVGEIVGDPQAVTLDPQAPAGTYRLAVGLYDLQTMQRLPVHGEKQTDCPENAICLEPPVEAVAK